MNFATIGASVWGFLKKIPDWVLWAIAAIVFLKFIDMRAERRGREKQKASQAKETDNNLDMIEAKADEHVDRAERIREANPVTGDPDRVSVTPLPDYHYRD